MSLLFPAPCCLLAEDKSSIMSEDREPNSLMVSFGGGVQSPLRLRAGSILSGSSGLSTGFFGQGGSGGGLKWRLTAPVCFRRGFGGLSGGVSSIVFSCGGGSMQDVAVDLVLLRLGRDAFPPVGIFLVLISLGSAATSAGEISTTESSAAVTEPPWHSSSSFAVASGCSFCSYRFASIGFEGPSLVCDRVGRPSALVSWDTSSSRLGKSGEDERPDPGGLRMPETAGDELRNMVPDMAGGRRRGARVRQAHLRTVVRNNVEVALSGPQNLWRACCGFCTEEHEALAWSRH